MRLPRDLSGAELVNVLRKFGYEIPDKLEVTFA